MAEENQWGTFGSIPFQALKSPVYGSYRHSKRALYTKHKRIVSRDFTGKLMGQKPLKERAGLALDKVSYRCKLSSIILNSLELNLLATAALSTGIGVIPGVSNALGNAIEDERFYTDITEFVTLLEDAHTEQEPYNLTIGDIYKGMYTLDEMTLIEKHKTNGKIAFVDMTLSFEEWVSE